ncbi:hypothetical protein C7459_103174 [Tumebacillus permanentifrigoris]|uniref:Uncharacterized protein n=1 Tax=Tumebacillus permanentifrigoris TaxID=378543 RepID=A0A316DCC1_9BACL|nr:hypothetical protein C7459_103174 [Tumebacillus permanentifrigoris]
MLDLQGAEQNIPKRMAIRGLMRFFAVRDCFQSRINNIITKE